MCEGLELELLDLRRAGRAGKPKATDAAVCAPMHGRITQVLVGAGDPVTAGTLMVIMEAMKMEHRLYAPRSGVVRAVAARQGEQVAARQLLIELAA